MHAQSSGPASAAGNRRGSRNCPRRSDHVFLVTAIVAEGRDLFVLAVDEIAPPARVADEAMTAMPADAHALARLPVGDVGADRVDAPGDFVSGHSRILQAGPVAFLHDRIAVADAARLNLDADLIAGGLGNIAFDKFKIAAGLADLDGFHARHVSPKKVQSVNRYHEADNKLRMTEEGETTQVRMTIDGCVRASMSEIGD